MLSFFKRRRVKQMVKQALADGVLTDAEDGAIDAASRELGLPESFAKGIRARHYHSTVKPIVARIMNCRRFTPADESRLREVSRQLKIEPQFPHEFRVYRDLWETETRGSCNLRPINATVKLTKNEECYHAAATVWAQHRTIRRHHGYVGGSVGFRVAKGVTLRWGRSRPIVSTEERLVDLSTGTLHVTNKKLLFVGDMMTTTITFRRLVDYKLYSDAIMLLKTTGKPDFFRLQADDIEFVAMLIENLTRS